MVGHSSDRDSAAQPTAEDAVTRPLDDDPGLAVVDAVSELTGRDPIDLPPIGRSVDTDALAAVCAGDGDLRLSFEYESHVVVIEDEQVRVAEPA